MSWLLLDQHEKAAVVDSLTEERKAYRSVPSGFGWAASSAMRNWPFAAAIQLEASRMGRNNDKSPEFTSSTATSAGGDP
jgi:hypothetical protein